MILVTTSVFVAIGAGLSFRLGAANPIIAWNETALDTIRFANTPPPVASRNLAILHVAVFDAVNSLNGPNLNYRVRNNVPATAVPEATADAAAEAGLSRIYGGIHFQAANPEGQKLGRHIGEYVVGNYLLPRSQARVTLKRFPAALEVTWPAGARIETCEILEGAHWEPFSGKSSITLGRDRWAQFYRIAD